MTLPPTQIGDKGQRFEVRASERAQPDRPIAWTNHHAHAVAIAQAWHSRPDRPRTWVVDRHQSPNPPEAA